LAERRKLGHYKDRIWERDWSGNPVGEAYTKKPEKMRLSKFYTSEGEKASPETYKMQRRLKHKLTRMLNARPFREHGLQILRGESGVYYLRLRGLSSDKAVWIKVENPEVLEAVKFLSEGKTT
jgi:hypothetical protein